MAAAFLARAAAGGGVNGLLDKPGMPSQGAYRYWRRTQVAFQAELFRLRGVRYARQSGAGHGRWRAWDEAAADRELARAWKGAAVAPGRPKDDRSLRTGGRFGALAEDMGVIRVLRTVRMNT